MHLYKELVKIIVENGEHYHLDSLLDVIDDLKNWYSHYATTIARLDVNEDSEEVDITSLINVHRELYDSVVALIKAVQHVYLKEEEGKLLDSL